MVIACCDSRVHISSMPEADTGEIFIPRNIANRLPPCDPDGDPHGTSAAPEFAVTLPRGAGPVMPDTRSNPGRGQEAVIVSMRNLPSCPFVAEAIEKDDLRIHGLWHGTGEGRLAQFMGEDRAFVPV